ncbi:SUKH superfamily protein [Flavobacterium sp. 270]|uniref:SMI1/KNR4 family protein n=1 Tax=Flavobacterium sp. 270 TaxID=2512114 RepID=UPI00106519B9|nr:SMI1/KNR4 family protein [Flavobacterium sp. 270]TDW51429.1 SUKH superfamily protein [Flavobacterium sp. 270]
MIKDIWKQPAEGFTEETIGRTEEQIIQKEIEIGFKFPALYKEHMKLQNGGYLWKSALNYNNDVNELLCNDATFDPIIQQNSYKTLKDVLLEYIDNEKLETSSNSDFLYLDRLPILSHMGGHTILCFDYGYNVENEYEIPEIVYFELECAENGYEEKLRLKSYDELINNLVYYGYESTSFYIGIKSNESIEKIFELIEKSFYLQLETKTDNGYGWYNFEKWFCGELKLNSSLSAYLKLTPNQFLSNTFLFQNDKEFNYVIDIDIRIGVESFQDNSNYLKSILMEKFEPFLSNLDWIFLEVPFHKENKIELEKVMQTFHD